MVSVSIFVSWWLQQLFSQKQFLDSQSGEMSFLNVFTQEIQGVDSPNFYSASSWILLHTSYASWNAPWFYLHQKEKTNFFCDSWSLTPTTSHILLSQILPFESFGSDISLWKSQDENLVQIFPYENRVVYNGTNLTGNYITPTDSILTGSVLYLSDALGQGIYRFNLLTPTVPWTRIIWETSYGDSWEETGNPLLTHLNFPTGLAWGEKSVFIADTENNRILRYDEPTGKIEKFLGEEDGLDEPTGLYYDTTRKSLFIVNSGKWEVLEYTSFSGSNTSNLSITFAPGNLTGVTEMKVNFLTTNSWITLTPSFSGMTMTEDYYTGGTDIFDYYISDFSQVETTSGDSAITWCTPSTQKFLESWVPKKLEVTCSTSDTGSTTKYFWTNALDFTSGNQYEINLQNITGDFSKNKSYAVKLMLFNSWSEVWENYYPYFTKGDNQILTQDDNRLRKVKTGLSYPTGIYKSWWNYFVYDFIERQKIEFDIGGNTISTTSTQSFDFTQATSYFANQTFPLPISDFKFQRTWNFLQVLLKYYKNYACYSEGKKAEKTFLWKKYIEN